MGQWGIASGFVIFVPCGADLANSLSGLRLLRFVLPQRIHTRPTLFSLHSTFTSPIIPHTPGIPIDGKTVFTSDHALKLEWLPNWIAIIGSGYIGLEFSDVYTALGTEVTFIEVRREVWTCGWGSVQREGGFHRTGH